MCSAVSESRQSRPDDGAVDVLDCRPGSHQPTMELVEFGADLRNLAVRMDQIEDIMKMEPMAEGTYDTTPVSAELIFQDVSFSYQKAADPLRRMALNHVTMHIPAGSFAAFVGPSGEENLQPGSFWQGFGMWKAEVSCLAERIYGIIPPKPLWIRSPLCSRIPTYLRRAFMTISLCTRM